MTVSRSGVRNRIGIRTINYPSRESERKLYAEGDKVSAFIQLTSLDQSHELLTLRMHEGVAIDPMIRELKHHKAGEPVIEAERDIFMMVKGPAPDLRANYSRKRRKNRGNKIFNFGGQHLRNDLHTDYQALDGSNKPVAMSGASPWCFHL